MVTTTTVGQVVVGKKGRGFIGERKLKSNLQHSLNLYNAKGFYALLSTKVINEISETLETRIGHMKCISRAFRPGPSKAPARHAN
jgi:hypothetical protein